MKVDHYKCLECGECIPADELEFHEPEYDCDPVCLLVVVSEDEVEAAEAEAEADEDAGDGVEVACDEDCHFCEMADEASVILEHEDASREINAIWNDVEASLAHERVVELAEKLQKMGVKFSVNVAVEA